MAGRNEDGDVKNIDGSAFLANELEYCHWLTEFEMVNSVRWFYNNGQMPCRLDDDLMVLKCQVNRRGATPYYIFTARMRGSNHVVTISGSHTLQTVRSRFEELYV